MINQRLNRQEIFYVVKEGVLEISQKFPTRLVAEQQMAGMVSKHNIRVVAVDTEGREILMESGF